MAKLRFWERAAALETLEARVAELESEIRKLKDGTLDQRLMFVSKNRSRAPGYEGSFYDNFESVSIQKAVLKIIDHLGIAFTYQAGTPANVTIKKIEIPEKEARNG